MNSPEHSRTFEAMRRQHLIDATIEALADVGFKATSLSQIARRADVSTGLFAHYFGDKDGLLEATLRFMAARLVRAMRQRLHAAGSAKERLYAVPDSALADQEFERRTSAVWLAFWGQITHSTRYQRIQRIYQRRMLSNLRHDLRALVPAHCVETYATMIASMIDGVWIRSHAATTQADGAQARALVRALIDGLIAGVAKTPRPMASATSRVPPICVPAPAPRSPVVIVTSPVTGEVLSSFVAARQTEVDDALRQAARGLAEWRGIAADQRERALRRCADLIQADGDELARLEAICTGRAVAQTVGIAVPRAARIFERFSILPLRPASERVELASGVFSYTRHEPIGIVAGFGHWSSPLLGACLQAAPALALGNAMIFQPSDLAPLTAMRLGEIMARAGIPAGVFSVLNGDADTTRLLVDHPDVAVATAGGSVTKSATIIFDDANMEQAALAVLQGCGRWTQTPDFSENRIFVQRGGLATFRARLLAQAATLRCGDPRDPATQIGALVSDAHLRHVRSMIDESIDAGAALLMGGRTDRHEPTTSFLEPTLLDGCRDDMLIVRQSLYAPILMILVFETDEDVLRMIASDQSEPAVGLFGMDSGHAHRFANRLRTNFCCINDSVLSPAEDGARMFDTLDDAAQTRTYSRSKRIFCRNERWPDA